MTRLNLTLVMAAMSVGLAACAGSDVLSASEQQITLNTPDFARAEKHCSQYGKSAQNTGQTPLRVTYACR